VKRVLAWLAVVCLAPAISFSGPTDGAPSAQRVSSILKTSCVKCHGGEKTKGGIDLVAMLGRTFSFDDVDGWSKVFSQVQSGNMPPDDEEKPLEAYEAKIILQVLQSKLGNGGIRRSERMITPDEYKNSIADIFQLDLENYDPIGDLYAFVSPEHKFYTVESSRLMNRFYLTAVMDGTERILREYHAGNVPPRGKPRSPDLTEKPKIKREERRVKERQAMEAFREELQKDGTLSAEDLKLIENKKYGRLQSRLESEIARRTPKSTNYTATMEFPMKMSPKIKDTTDGFFEYAADHWGIRGKSWIGNNNMPIMLLGGYGQQFRILPPGKYRLTIRATATDRETITNVPDTQSEETAWSNNDRLDTELCKLVVFKDANRTKTRSDPLTQATPVGAFYIEDDKINDYTLDVAFHWNTQLGVLFENGVANVIKAAGRHPVMHYDENDEVVYAKAENKLPTIRIHDVTLEKIGDVEMGDLYIQDIASFSDQVAIEKIETFTALAYLDDASAYTEFYRNLRESGATPFDAYVDAMKWLFVTSDYLYIDGRGDDFKSRLRHASYSLLKTSPSKAFAGAYASYSAGKMDVNAFTRSVVESESFGNFVASFASQWLQLSEIGQNAPDRVKYAPFYDDNLEGEFRDESASYIRYLFTENRKLSELVDSDYHFINDKLAVLYGIENVRHHDIRQVDAGNRNNRLGVLSHAGFMAATANGVEDLPFRRSKWISENILDRMIPPPPDEVDVTVFGKSEKQDFASRIEAHISSESCRECHKLLDPVAIDIHMFDGLGRLKSDDFSPDDADKHLESLKKTVTMSERRIARAFTKNLITFVHGRKLGIDDLQRINQIMDETKEEGYRAQDILTKIIAEYFPPHHVQ
jgi:hypothetical protein